MFLNGNIPLFKAYVRMEYLYNGLDHCGEHDDCMVFGVRCVRGRAPVFNALMPNGAVYYGLPLNAFTTKTDVSPLSDSDTYFWDSFSYYFNVLRFDYLREMDVRVLLKNGDHRSGRYMFTIDWCDPDGSLPSTHAEIASEHKCHHVINLDDGNFVAYPNNRILFRDASFVVRDEVPDYRTNDKIWYGESGKTEDTERMYYDVTDSGI